MVDLKLSCGNDGFWKYEILEFVLPPQIWTSKKNHSDEILRFYIHSYLEIIRLKKLSKAGIL